MLRGRSEGEDYCSTEKVLIEKCVEKPGFSSFIWREVVLDATMFLTLSHYWSFKGAEDEENALKDAPFRLEDRCIKLCVRSIYSKPSMKSPHDGWVEASGRFDVIYDLLDDGLTLKRIMRITCLGSLAAFTSWRHTWKCGG